MKKMKILGIGNSGRFNYLIIKKEEGFLQWLNELLNLGIKNFIADVEYYSNEKDNYNKTLKKLSKLSDCHEVYEEASGKRRVDVFYGNKRVFISIILPESQRKKLMDKLEEISIWAK